MAGTLAPGFASLLRPLAVVAALAGGCVLAVPALADQRGHGGHEDHGHHDHDHDRGFHRGPSFGFFFNGFGGPAYVAPPPVYYAPAYPYTPTPVSGVYAGPYGYCRDYRTYAGIETACQQPDGVWRFIN
jgi:hypothetical protein